MVQERQASTVCLSSDRVKTVDLELLPNRLSLSYEEAAVLLHREKSYVEQRVASGDLIALERGRVSRRQVEAYVDRLDTEAAKPVSMEPPMRPKRSSSRK